MIEKTVQVDDKSQKSRIGGNGNATASTGMSSGVPKTLSKQPPDTSLNFVAVIPPETSNVQKERSSLTNAEFEAELGRSAICTNKIPVYDPNSGNDQAFSTPKAKSRRTNRLRRTNEDVMDMSADSPIRNVLFYHLLRKNGYIQDLTYGQIFDNDPPQRLCNRYNEKLRELLLN